MGRVFLHYITEEMASPAKTGLNEKLVIYQCKYCKTHLSEGSQLMSKAFHGSTGSAYLFKEV